MKPPLELRYRAPSVAVSPIAKLMVVLMLTIMAVPSAWAADDADAEAGARESQNVLDLLIGSGPVGLALVLLSLAGIAMCVNGFMTIRRDKLIPEGFAGEVDRLTTARRYVELQSLSRTQDSMIARVIGAGMEDGTLGVLAVREAMSRAGNAEITALHHRINWIATIAAVAPMLGLLGTVVGMIQSFGLLGASQGTAQPDELAVGISQALVTTTMGLVIAVPLMFCHAMLRDRLTRIGMDLAAVCERAVRVMTFALESHVRSGSGASGKSGAQISHGVEGSSGKRSSHATESSHG